MGAGGCASKVPSSVLQGSASSTLNSKARSLESVVGSSNNLVGFQGRLYPFFWVSPDLTGLLQRDFK